MIRGKRAVGAAAALLAGAITLLVGAILTVDRAPHRMSAPRSGGDLGTTPSERSDGTAQPAPAWPAPEEESGEVRVAPSEATWVRADAPDVPTAPADVLFAGDHSAGAVAYLKFDVPELPHAEAPDRVSLWLARTQAPLPELVELVAVPDISWEAEGLTWRRAPALGPVLQSVEPAADDNHVAFDLAGVTDEPGVYAFAVTVPADRGYAAFAGPESDVHQPLLHLAWTHQPPPAPRPEASAPRPAAAAPVPSRVAPTAPECAVEEKLVPSCGALWGVAPAAHTGQPRTAVLAEFEATTGRRQHIYHAYHRGEALFPTAEEAAIASEGRILFLNWKPQRWSWAQIAAGAPAVDAHLDRLAEHIRATFPDRFFFTVHHEPENNVRPQPGSGREAADYAAMFRYVVEGLRARGVDNLVTVVAYMAYVPWNAQPWWEDLYPGDDVVDWIGWDAYAYSDPGYGYGDFAEMVNRRSADHPEWPGFYTWATRKFPDKPFMLAEWGVWHSAGNPDHMARFYESVARQAPLFPRLKAFVYFDTPSDQRRRDSRPTVTGEGLAAYRQLGAEPYFQVRLRPLA